MSDLVLTQQRGNIFEIILNRTEQRNALNWDMMHAIEQAFEAAERAFNDQTARVIFIRAEGRAFSSGIDLAAFDDYIAKYGEHWRQNLFPVTSLLQNVLNKIEQSSLPVICIMHGYCLGMGLELALACDFRIAAERTKFSLPESRLGIIPDVGGTTRLVHLVGPSRAKELIMTGRNFEAEEALAWGIVNYVVSKEELLKKAEEFAAELILSAPLAVSYTKRVINDMMDNLRRQQIEAWAQAHLIRTQDFERGVQAMLTKTYPIEWKGK